MRNRLPSIFLILSLVFLAGAAIYVVSLNADTDAPRSGRAAIQVGTILDPALAENHPVDSDSAGQLHFRLAEGEVLLGLSMATTFPMEDGMPIVARSVECAGAQRDGRLDLRQWLRKYAGEAENHRLHFGLLVRTPSGIETRLGWAALPVADLLGHSLEVQAPPRKGIDVHVETAGGDRVPGAFVAIDVSPMDPGPLSGLVYTDVKGAARVSGLDDVPLIASLPNGAGPHKAAVRQPFLLADGAVKLVVPVRGRWEFSEQVAELPHEGGSFHVDVSSGPGEPMPAVWPVATWLAPRGSGRISCFLMFAAHEGRRRPAPAKLQIKGYEEFRLGNAKGRHRLTLPLQGKKVAVSVLPDAG